VELGDSDLSWHSY